MFLLIQLVISSDNRIIKRFTSNDEPTKSSNRYFQRHILRNAKLMFNGIDRFSSRPNEFFNLVQPFNIV